MASCAKKGKYSDNYIKYCILLSIRMESKCHNDICPKTLCSDAIHKSSFKRHLSTFHPDNQDYF